MNRDAVPDDPLDALLAQARTDVPPLDPGLAHRLTAAAWAAQPRARPGLWARLRTALADLGGAPGLAGLSAAGVAGLWIGFAQPLGAGTLTALVWNGAATVSPALAELVDAPSPFDDFDAAP